MNSILDRLEAVGLALRNQLSSTRTIAEKLEITPELQDGLDRGIHQWLKKLINSRELTLSVKDHQCRLAIENNGTSLTPILLDIPHKKRRSGGYGTKLMKTIAAEIPNGAWQRVPLEEGGMRVTLEWTIDTP